MILKPKDTELFFASSSCAETQELKKVFMFKVQLFLLQKKTPIPKRQFMNTALCSLNLNLYRFHLIISYLDNPLSRGIYFKLIYFCYSLKWMHIAKILLSATANSPSDHEPGKNSQPNYLFVLTTWRQAEYNFQLLYSPIRISHYNEQRAATQA